MKHFIRKAQRSAQAYLILTGAGAVALVAAPVVALYQLVRPSQEEELKAHLKKEVSKTGEHFREQVTNISETIGAALGDEDTQWKTQHNKLHKNISDEEWEEKYGR